MLLAAWARSILAVTLDQGRVSAPRQPALMRRPPPVEPQALAACSNCGVVFSMTARNARRPHVHRCPWCRMPKRRRRPDDEDRAYWLERFSLEEIRELAAGIWA